MKWAFCVALLGIAVPLNAAQSGSSQTTASKSGSTARKRKAKRVAKSSYQAHPDAARYQQIQQALADRGYFKGQINGQWGDDSVDALKRFQADQKLDSDGKINSLTLIGLGLGPKHDAAAVSPPPPPVAAPSASAPH